MTAETESTEAGLQPAPPAARSVDLAGSLEDRAMTVDLWLSDSLGGAQPEDEIWLARLRGLALAGAAITLPMTAWKAIGPLTTASKGAMMPARRPRMWSATIFATRFPSVRSPGPYTTPG